MVEFRDGNPDPIQIQPYSFQGYGRGYGRGYAGQTAINILSKRKTL